MADRGSTFKSVKGKQELPDFLRSLHKTLSIDQQKALKRVFIYKMIFSSGAQWLSEVLDSRPRGRGSWGHTLQCMFEVYAKDN